MTRERRRIRPYQEEDESAVGTVWHRAGLAAYTYLPTWQALTLEHTREIFRDVIRANCHIWVGTLDGQVVAYLAMDGSSIDRLYVDPTEWRRGWGTRFVQFAKNLCPDGLALFTHQESHAARALYEKHGFRAVKFGISPPPECAPDVKYHWRPSDVTQPTAADEQEQAGQAGNPTSPVGRVGYPTFLVGRTLYLSYRTSVGNPTFP